MQPSSMIVAHIWVSHKQFPAEADNSLHHLMTSDTTPDFTHCELELIRTIYTTPLILT